MKIVPACALPCRGPFHLPLILSLLMVLAAPVQAGNRTSDQVRAVIPPDSPPTYFQDKQTGKAAGFAVDIMDAIAARAGLSVSYLFEDGWSDIIETVTSGQADIVPGMGVSREREASLAFSLPIDAFPIVFFVRTQHGGIESTPGIHSVGVLQGSVAASALRDRKDLHLVPYQGFSQGLFDLLAGTIEAFACPAPTLWQLARETGVDDHIKVVDRPIAEITRAIGVRKGDRALLDRLNHAIEGFTGTPEYQRIYVKWYGRPTPYWTDQRMFMAAAAGVLVIMGLMAVWRYLSVLRLNRELKETIAQRQEMEAALQRTTTDLSTFFDVALDLLCIADTDGRFLRLNRTWERTLGYPRETLMAGKFLDFVHPDDLQPTLDAMAVLASQHEVVNFVNRYRHRDGSYRWIEWRSVPANTMIYAAARDITEQKQAMEKLRDHAAVLRSFLNAITESALLMDRQGIILAANDTLAQRLNRTAPEIIGRSVYDLIPPEVAARRKTYLDAVFRSGIPARFEDERAGMIIDNSVYPVFGPSGEVSAVAIVGFDITERKQAQAALEQSEQKYRMLFDSAIDAIFIVDQQGRFIDVNRTAHERLGYSREEMRGLKVADIDAPEYAGRVSARIEELLRDGKSTFESANVRKDGTVMPVEINARVIDYEGRKAMFSIIRDITERKAAEQEREKLIAELQKALAEIKTLHGILPICASCKRIRDDKGSWQPMEMYISSHTGSEFSHGLCSDCAKRLYPDIYREKT